MDKIQKIEVKEQHKYAVMYLYSALVVLGGLLVSPFQEVVEGIIKLTVSPALLLTDYFQLGGIGAALVNSGMLLLFSVFLAQKSKAPINGKFLSAMYFFGGFALFGKNFYNVLSIITGVFLYGRLKKERFAKHVNVALLGTALAPVVSQLSFGMNLDPLLGLVLGNLAGIIIGLILQPLAVSFVNFHQGYNLYNLGFTAGMAGMVVMSLFRLAGHDHKTVSIVYPKTETAVAVFLVLYFVSMIGFGALSSKDSLKNYGKLLKLRVKAATDFVELAGFPLALLNMGVMGLLCMAVALLFKAPLNGPVIGAVFTVSGFSSFGNHPKNSLPVMAGAILGYLLSGAPLSATGAMMAIIFSTTLAPIAGDFGLGAGLLAGLLHVSIVSNVGHLHGGMNLYNNGFAGGFAAAALAPLLQAYIRKKA
ncbi:MAG: DUF1576 domain-containing protein [Christensenellales bacterium]